MVAYLKCIFYFSPPMALNLSGNEVCSASHLVKEDRKPYDFQVSAAFPKPGHKKRTS